MPSEESDSILLQTEKQCSSARLGLRDSLFISYSHKDREWCDLFRKMLSADPTVRVWTDDRLRPGGEWDGEIQSEISTTRTALLLLSSNFTQSHYIRTTELPQILAEREKGLVVKWILVDDLPPSAIPDDLRTIHGCRVWNEKREDASLHSIKHTNLLSPTVKRVCEEILTEMRRFQAIPRRELFGKVRDLLRGKSFTIQGEITVGQHSVVYGATKPGGMAIVKALVQTPVLEWKVSFENELERAKALKGRGFIPISDWILESDPKVIISEYQSKVQPLKSVLNEFRSGQELARIDRVRYLLQVLAETLAEYHEAGFVFGNLRPSDILIETTAEGPAPRIPAFRFSQMLERCDCGPGGDPGCPFTREFMTYMAPEQFYDAVPTEATDQYSLGLLAVELLQSEPPVEVLQLADLELKRRFFEDPLAFPGKWQGRSPELTKVIARMLALNQEDRWPSMRALSRELGPSRPFPSQNRLVAKRSYRRLGQQAERFYRAFYERLFSAKSSLRKLFDREKDPVDWSVHYRALDAALCLLVNFSEEEAGEEPTTLTETARRHRERFALDASDFDCFLEAFLGALEDFNEGSEDIKQAWRATLTPGIEYMKKHACRDAKSRAAKRARRRPVLTGASGDQARA